MTLRTPVQSGFVGENLVEGRKGVLTAEEDVDRLVG
jgi:hypothetical protein